MPENRLTLIETADLAVSQAIQLLAMTEALVYDPPEQVQVDRKSLKVTTSNCLCLVAVAKEKLELATRSIENLLDKELKADV